MDVFWKLPWERRFFFLSYQSWVFECNLWYLLIIGFVCFSNGEWQRIYSSFRALGYSITKKATLEWSGAEIIHVCRSYLHHRISLLLRYNSAISSRLHAYSLRLILTISLLIAPPLGPPDATSAI